MKSRIISGLMLLILSVGLLTANTNFDTMKAPETSTDMVQTITQDQIDQWMEKYGDDKVYGFEIPADETYENYIDAFVRDPADGVLNNYLSKSDRDPIGASKVLINTIWLGGDARIKENLDLRMSLMSQLTEKLVGGQGRIVKRSVQVKGFDNQECHVIEVPVDETYEEYITATVKHPQPGLLNEYLRKADRVPLDAARKLVSTIWLKGDERIKTERKYLMSFVDTMSEVLVGGQGRVKKLSRSQAS